RSAPTQDPLYLVGSTVADPKPDHLWRRTMEKRKLIEVSVLGNNGQAARARVIPNSLIRSPIEANTRDVLRAGKDVGETSHQNARKVLIEKQLHLAGAPA